MTSDTDPFIFFFALSQLKQVQFQKKTGDFHHTDSSWCQDEESFVTLRCFFGDIKKRVHQKLMMHLTHYLHLHKNTGRILIMMELFLLNSRDLINYLLNNRRIINIAWCLGVSTGK